MRPVGGKLVDGEPGLTRRVDMPCHCLLVESDAGLVLVDTGVGSPAVTRPATWLGRPFTAGLGVARAKETTALAHVRALGFDPADVRHIVLTHLDIDHAGGLVDFPDATVHVHAPELRALEHPANTRERARYRRVQFEHGPRFVSYEADGERWFGFDAVRELDGLGADILLVPLPGHTRGHAGVALDTDSGPLLHAGDAYFFHDQLAAEPHCPPGLALFERALQTDRAARVRNHERLGDLSRSGEATVFCAHDPVELARLS